MCIYGANSLIMCVLTLNTIGEKMKNILSALLLISLSSLSYAGGHAMSSGKSSSGVHFFGQLYVGYDDTSTGKAADIEKLDDGGGKSRLGLRMTESLGNGLQLIGNLEYKFDPVDGTQNDSGTCTSVVNQQVVEHLIYMLVILGSRQLWVISVLVHLNRHIKLWVNLTTTWIQQLL
jgi:hypothetical protein